MAGGGTRRTQLLRALRSRVDVLKADYPAPASPMDSDIDQPQGVALPDRGRSPLRLPVLLAPDFLVARREHGLLNEVVAATPVDAPARFVEHAMGDERLGIASGVDSTGVVSGEGRR